MKKKTDLALCALSGLLLLAASVPPLTWPAPSFGQEGPSRSMFADERAVAVGDLIPLLVQESTTASKNNQTVGNQLLGLGQ